MSRPVVVTETLGGSPLSRAARRGETPEWYRALPRDDAEWRAYARDVAASVAPDWLTHLGPAMSPGGAAAARLERVAGGDGIVVTTGQQPGLFGGPLMTFVKALSARALADVLEEQLGIPVAPVFWAATDDADFDEAAVVSIATDDGAHELRLARTAPTGTPMGSVPIGADVAGLAERLRAVCGSVAHVATLDTALREYHAGATVGGAYVALLRSVLEPLGIAVLDASHSAVAGAAAPLLRRALERGDDVAAALRLRGDAIRAAGFAPQVEEVPGLSLVFANEPDGKRRLPIAGAADWMARNADTRLSATVLLRPVLERALLPTAMYVGGPGEFAYFAQVTAVAEALGSPVPLVVPRWSTTIIESRVQRGLSELGVAPDAVRDPAALEGRVAREHMPAELAAALAGMRAGMSTSVDVIARTNDGLVPDPVLDGLRRAMGHRLDRAERRFVAAVKRRETELMRRVAMLRGALFPHGGPQERSLAFVPFLARHGDDLVGEMSRQATDHARKVVRGVPSGAGVREAPVAARR